MQKLKSCAGIGGAAIILWLGMLTAASATTITVTTGAASGAGSLSNAVATALANSETNTILFNSSVTTVTLTSSIIFGYHACNSSPLTIDGGGTVTIDAGGNCQNFTDQNDRPLLVVLKGLTFINGDVGAIGTVSKPGSFVITNCVFRNNSGGSCVSLTASDSNSTLTVIGCTFDHNTATTASGGGLNVAMPGLIQNCTFSNNAAYFGGALFLNPSAGQTNWIVNCDFFTNSVAGSSSNTKDGGGAAVVMTGNGNVVMDHCVIRNNVTKNLGFGGALEYFDGYAPSTGLLTISNSVIVANVGGVHGGGCRFEAATRMVNCLIVSNDESGVSGSSGGGLCVDKGSGGETTMPAVYLINTTISGNKCASGSRGGGVDLRANGPSYIYNCTITTNGPAGATGGGVGVRDNPSLLSIYSTIVANNSGSDLYTGAAIALLNHCLIGTNVGYTVTTSTSTLVNKNPLLSSLADNGGPVLPGNGKLLTFAIGKTSLAFNQGSNPLGLAYDQRGSPYVREWPTGSPDIGAYEYSETAVSKGTTVLFR